MELDGVTKIFSFRDKNHPIQVHPSGADLTASEHDAVLKRMDYDVVGDGNTKKVFPKDQNSPMFQIKADTFSALAKAIEKRAKKKGLTIVQS